MYSRLVRVWVGDGQRGLGLQLLVPGPLPPGDLLNLPLELSATVIVIVDGDVVCRDQSGQPLYPPLELSAASKLKQTFNYNFCKIFPAAAATSRILV